MVVSRMPRRLCRLRFTSQNKPQSSTFSRPGNGKPGFGFNGAYLSQNTDASRVRLGWMIGGIFRECLGGFAACGLLRKTSPQSSTFSRPGNGKPGSDPGHEASYKQSSNRARVLASVISIGLPPQLGSLRAEATSQSRSGSVTPSSVRLAGMPSDAFNSFT